MIEHFDQNIFITTEIGFFRFTSTWSTTRIPLSSATLSGSCSSCQSTHSSPGLASSSSTAPSTSTATHSGTAMRVRASYWLLLAHSRPQHSIPRDKNLENQRSLTFLEQPLRSQLCYLSSTISACVIYPLLLLELCPSEVWPSNKHHGAGMISIELCFMA